MEYMTQIKSNRVVQKIECILRFLILLFSVIINFSCQSKTENRLTGLWSIDIDSSIVVNRPWLSIICDNAIIIGSNNDCKLPAICEQGLQRAKGHWYLVHGSSSIDSLLFNVNNNPLSGKYSIKFYKDYNTMRFKIKLQNDSTILICSKSIISNTSNSKNILDNQ